MSQADELEDRLIDFVVRIINLANALPDSPAAKHMGRQLLRSGTSPAPNYAEARRAEFISENGQGKTEALKIDGCLVFNDH